MNDKLLPVVRVDRKIRWHYTTTILRLRIGARLTRYRIVNFTILLALSAGTLMASAGTPYRHSAGPLLPLAVAVVSKGSPE